MRYACFCFIFLLLASAIYAKSADALWNEAQQRISASEWEIALDVAHQALEASRNEGVDSLTIDIRLALGYIYYRIGELDAAIRETRNATLEVPAEVVDEQRLTAYYRLGEYFQAKGMYRGGSEYFKHASELALGLNDLNMVANIYFRLSENAAYSGRYDEALEYSYKSIDLYRELSDNTHLAQVYNTLSTVYRKLERYDQAIDFLTKAQILNMNSENWTQVGDNYYNLGQIYVDRRHLSTAQQYFQRAILIFTETDDHHGLALCHLALAQAACDNNQLYEATQHAQAALDTVVAYNETVLAPRAYMMKGRIQLRENNIIAAQASLDKALVSARKLSATEDLLDIYFTLSKLHEQEGAYSLSLEYYKSYDSLKDSLHSDNAQQKIAEMQTVYEYFEKEKEIDQLRNRLVLEQMNREKERLEHESDLEIQKLRSTTERSELENRLRLEQITSEQRKLLLENEQMTSRQQRLELQNAQIRTRHQRQQLILSVVGLVMLGVLALIVAQRYRHERNLRSQIDSQKRELESAYMKLKEAQHQKIELEQLRSVMAMSVTMNHELNQPLMIIQGNVEMLEHSIHSNGPTNKYLERIQLSVERISHLLERIRRMEEVRFGHYGGGSDMVNLTEQDHVEDEYARGAELDTNDLQRIAELFNQKKAQS